MRETYAWGPTRSTSTPHPAANAYWPIIPLHEALESYRHYSIDARLTPIQSLTARTGSTHSALSAKAQRVERGIRLRRSVYPSHTSARFMKTRRRTHALATTQLCEKAQHARPLHLDPPPELAMVIIYAMQSRIRRPRFTPGVQFCTRPLVGPL